VPPFFVEEPPLMLYSSAKLFPSHVQLCGMKLTSNVPGSVVIVWLSAISDVMCLTIGQILNDRISDLRIHSSNFLYDGLRVLTVLLVLHVVTLRVEARDVSSRAIVLPVYRVGPLSDYSQRNYVAAFPATRADAAACLITQLASQLAVGNAPQANWIVCLHGSEL
jgi:hypothetical protein